MEDACSLNAMVNAAIVASIAASNPKMVEALGGAQMYYEAATAAIGVLNVFPTAADEEVLPFGNNDVDPVPLSRDNDASLLMHTRRRINGGLNSYVQR